MHDGVDRCAPELYLSLNFYPSPRRSWASLNCGDGERLSGFSRPTFIAGREGTVIGPFGDGAGTARAIETHRVASIAGRSFVPLRLVRSAIRSPLLADCLLQIMRENFTRKYAHAVV